MDVSLWHRCFPLSVSLSLLLFLKFTKTFVLKDIPQILGITPSSLKVASGGTHRL